MSRRRVSLVLGWAILTTGCVDEAQLPAEPAGIAWELESGMVEGVEVPVLDSHPITLAFTADEINGTAACNGYWAEYTISGPEIGLTGLGVTDMACVPEEIMMAEQSYFSALPRVRSVSVTEETLILGGDGVELVFAALPPLPTTQLTGTVWVLESLIGEGSASNVEGGRATLELYTDGSMLGSTGCRTLHGRYAVVGAEVTMPEMAAQGECEASLQPQDAHVVTVLGDGFRPSVEGQTMTLTSRGGLGLVYHAED